MSEPITPRQFEEELRHLGMYGSEAEKVIELVLNDHRTHQASCMRFCVQVIRAFAKVKYTDLRNEAAVNFAKEVVAEPSLDFDRLVEFCEKIMELAREGKIHDGFENPLILSPTRPL